MKRKSKKDSAYPLLMNCVQSVISLPINGKSFFNMLPSLISFLILEYVFNFLSLISLISH